MVLNVLILYLAPIYCARKATMYEIKAKADSKIRMTLTGAQVNALAHILRNQTVLDGNAPLIVELCGKFATKQIKNSDS